MMSGKKYKAVRDKIKSEGVYPLDKALQMVIENPVARFDESVDAALVLGVDTRKNDQQVRGSVALPHGLGRKVRILVFAKGALEEDAKKAGADFVGGEDMVEKIKQGWLDFDCAISTPDMMPVVSKVAKTLGPKGLMPNPKLGTVTIKVAQAVEREKKGTASFRADKNGIIHSSVGRRSMGLDGVKENLLAFLRVVIKDTATTKKDVDLTQNH
ncbi:MAG: 50S ribosomal protein L1, partial [Bdellovibrionales bacterium]|nr:50S ribosomal protein L1 [Bdellovibrionales bacterium]